MIHTAKALAELVERALDSERVALDTEFVWNRTYYPKLGVIQLALADGDCHLIDPVAIVDLSPLGALLEHPKVELILHDAQQDLAILRRVTGAFPRNVFDTRCAAGLANMSSTTSLAELLEQTLGVVLDKTETLTNWVRRPLSEDQLAYAIEDVRYLHEAHDVLQTHVEEIGRSTWLTEEMAAYDDPRLYEERDPREQFTRIKGTGRASPRELAILRELTAWREKEAQRCDRPRNHVLTDEVLVLLARRKPRSLEELGRLRALGKHRYDRYLLEQIRRGLAVPDAECPPRPRRPLLDKEVVERKLAQSMDHLRQQSDAARIDAPFVAARAEVRNLVIDAVAATPEDHRLLRGWRRDFIGEALYGIATCAE
ncbi:MAG: ribonuclease D [Gemmatimonadetes bacterium]|nr:ribonuclease D [Gemmatimonadota bacterium]MYB72035.1 ribonuclease D [Gemmatimonadota bacterium]